MDAAIITGICGVIAAALTGYAGLHRGRRLESAQVIAAEASARHDNAEAADTLADLVAKLSLTATTQAEQITALRTELGEIRNDNAVLNARIRSAEAHASAAEARASAAEARASAAEAEATRLRLEVADVSARIRQFE